MIPTSIDEDFDLGEDQFHQLRDIIYEKSGIFFTDNKLYLLQNRLGNRLKDLGLSSFEEYIRYLRTQNGNMAEYHKIYNAVTINETYFFRFQAQLDAFQRKLLPNLVDQRRAINDRQLNIWSAASSSGEEVYTLAMILDEYLGSTLGNWNVQLLGTDISQRALNQAREATYTRNSFRGAITDLQKETYFEPIGNEFRLDGHIKSIPEFRYLNLNDNQEIGRLKKMDFIFCRNVLIYFDEVVKEKVLRSIYDVLSHGGYLFLGEAESLHGISSSFKVEYFPGAFAYKKD
ncbi:MAG: protein-glutamate O-methyltransferase CheR [Fidelibacterota bacterium]|nr:MAG: protein-glutamate O-methyltransferase CheR [Candidatus Neomarinimicrobiota bacterium]